MKIDQTNPIAAAVAPLKADAVKHAAEYAAKKTEAVRKALEAADWDLDTAAPYPDSLRVSHRTYASMINLRDLYRSLVDLETVGNPYIRPKYKAHMSDAKCAKFIEDAEKAAAAAYDLFVMKLVGKIGSCQTADLDGNHIWGHSILRVTFADKAAEKWKTQTITNISKLGKVFLQWPTRKVK